VDPTPDCHGPSPSGLAMTLSVPRACRPGDAPCEAVRQRLEATEGPWETVPKHLRGPFRHYLENAEDTSVQGMAEIVGAQGFAPCRGVSFDHPPVSPFLSKEGEKKLCLRDTPFVRLTAALKLSAVPRIGTALSVFNREALPVRLRCLDS